MLGGRAAEQIVYGDVTTGAESDLETVTRIAKQMVGRWGMSEAIGNVSVLPGPNDAPLLLPRVQALSEDDRAGRTPVARSWMLVTTKRFACSSPPIGTSWKSLTKVLLERETLDEADADPGRPDAPPAAGTIRSLRADDRS